MLYGGFATGAIGLLGHFFTALEQDSLIPMHERAFMTVGVSISSIIGGHLLVIANQVNLYFKTLLFCFLTAIELRYRGPTSDYSGDIYS